MGGEEIKKESKEKVICFCCKKEIPNKKYEEGEYFSFPITIRDISHQPLYVERRMVCEVCNHLED